MYSLVPAIVSMMIFWVLSPKSANLIMGKGFPCTYFDLSKMFSGLRSRWVIRWLWSSWTPLLICKIHSNAYFSFILLSFIKLRASLFYGFNTTMILPNSTQSHTKLPLAGRLCQIFLICFHSRLFLTTSLSVFPSWCLKDLRDFFWLFEWRLSLWHQGRRCDRPWSDN